MLLITGIVFSTLILSLIAFPLSATAQGPDSTPEKAQVVSALGIIPGRDLIVHVWVLVPPGADKNEAANEAIKNQGARPLTPDEFSTISLYWDQYSDGDPGNDFVIQNYNPNNDPTNGQGILALRNTHATWSGVDTSIFNYAYGEDTDRCPSLVRECPGRQTFDGNNDVAWLALKDKNVLGVTWSGTSIDEADMALNTKFTWNTNGDNFDVETVYLHENGHVLGLGHSDVTGAVMEAVYAGERRILYQDDIDGIAWLYPTSSVGASPTVTISSPADDATFGTGATIDFAGSASDTEDYDVTLTANLVWTSNNMAEPIGTGGSFSTTLIDGTHTITAEVTDSDENSGSDSITITVGEISTSTKSIAQPIVYDLTGGKDGDKHLLFTVHVVDDLGSNVDAADVSISISLEGSVVGWSGSGTTGADGKVTFQLSNARSGCYSTSINSITSDPPWDGVQPQDDGKCKL